MTDSNSEKRTSFSVGEHVRVKSGIRKGYVGEIEEIRAVPNFPNLRQYKLKDVPILWFKFEQLELVTNQ